SFTVSSATKISATVPAGAGSGPVIVTTPNGSGISATSFTVIGPPPAIAGSAAAGAPTSSAKGTGPPVAPSETGGGHFDAAGQVLAWAPPAGTFTATLTAPASALRGSHWITADGRHSGLSAQAAFTVQTNWAQQGNGAKHQGVNTVENLLYGWTV